MIREPYNINPYNEAKDLSNSPRFSFTFGGDALIGYDYKIQDNNNAKNILKNWTHMSPGSTYTPLVESGTVASPTTQTNQPITIYNDETYYFTPAKIPNIEQYSNRGLIWKLRLFEDNLKPTNLLQTGQIDNVLFLSDTLAIIKGTITGLLEESDEYIFKNNQGYSDHVWNDLDGSSFAGKIPDSWTRNVVKIGQQDYPVLDYESHAEQFYTAQKPDTYYIGTKVTGDGQANDYYIPVKTLSYYTYDYSTSNGQYICTPTLHSLASTLTRTNFSGIAENAIVKDGDGKVYSIKDRVCARDLSQAKTNNASTSVKLKDTSTVMKQVTENGATKPVEATFEVVWGATGQTIKNSKLLNFTIEETTITYDTNGQKVISKNISPGSRSALGLNNLLYIDPSTGSYRNASSYITEQEKNALQSITALASTTISLSGKEDSRFTLSEEDISFDKENESLIYTIEFEDNCIKYGQESSTSTNLTRVRAKEKGLLDISAADSLIILSTTDGSVDTSNEYFSYEEMQKIQDNDYGIYTLGEGLADDKINLVSPTKYIHSTGELTGDKVINFSVFNNYYDSNYYYFTNQIQPKLSYQIDDLPYYSYNSYIEALEKGETPTEREPNLTNNFEFQTNENAHHSVGTEDNPLVTFQRFFPIVSSLAGLSYNFKYYEYEIFAGTLTEDNTFIYKETPIQASGKVFSRNIYIDFNDYTTVYDRFKIKLKVATSENGIYYYYTYIYPTVDLMQDDGMENRYAFSEYDEDKGAVKLTWTRDNAYPPINSGVEKVQYGVYLIQEKQFPLWAYKIPSDGYLSYSQKGSELLRINPLHDFQISFSIDRILNGLETLSISPLIAFYDNFGAQLIQLRIEENVFRLVENGVTQSNSPKNTLIEVSYSFVDRENGTGEDKNKIYQYAIQKTGTLPTNGNLAPTIQDLKKYCFHFYLFPWGSNGKTLLASYKLTRFYNKNSAATKELIMSSKNDWQLGFYGEGAGNNAELSTDDSGQIGGINLPSGPSKANYDTLDASASYLLSGGRPVNQMLSGLSKISLYGDALYFGIFDVNRRGAIASEDNFVMNFNNGLIGSSSLTQQVYGYRIFRNKYNGLSLNDYSMARNFIGQLNEIYASIAGGLTTNDENRNPIRSYEEIEDDAAYIVSTNAAGEPTKLITGRELKHKINEAIVPVRDNAYTYFYGKGYNIDFDNYDYGYLVAELYKIDIVAPDESVVIADLDITKNTIAGTDSLCYIYDYNVPNKGFYRYQIVPLLRDKTYNVLIAKTNERGESILEIDDEQWHMTSIVKRQDGSYQPKETWNFILGVQNAQYTQNFSKTIQTGFAPYPKVMTGMPNYKTTQFSGYLGEFKFGEDGSANTYSDTIEIIDRWNKFIYKNNQILVKDPKGHVFIAAISQSTDTSDIAIPDMPTQVSCSLTQVGDTKSTRVYTL